MTPGALHLRVHARADLWSVSVGRLGRAARTVDVAAALGRAVSERVERSEDPARGPRVLLPMAWEHVLGAQRAAGDALAELWAAPALAEVIGGELASQRAQVLAIEAEGEGASRLPWELLRTPGSDGVERDLGVPVVRLVPGRGSARGARGAWTVALWAPTTDPATDALADAVRARAAFAGLALVIVNDPGEVPDELTGPVILVLCAHGETDGEVVALRGPDRALVRPEGWLRVADAVVLLACHAAADVGAAIPATWIQAGARAVVAPQRTLRIDVLCRFSDALLGALAAEATLVEALRQARRAVFALALPHPEARWYSLRMFVPDVECAMAGGRGRWQPALSGLDLSEVAATWLDAAHAEAARFGHAFVGVEHLAVAADGLPRTDEAYRARTVGRQLSHGALAALSTLPSRGAGGEERRATPRLLAALSAASRGGQVTADALQQALGELIAPLQLRLQGGTVSPDALGATAGPEAAAVDLEVVGGPEDGLRLALSAERVVGRWSAGGAGQLYASGHHADCRLSRQHAGWLGRGRLRLLKPLHQAPRPASAGVLEVLVGDPIALTPTTWLVGVAASEGAA